MNYSIISSPWVKKIVPWALTAVSGAGVIGTAYLAAKATPKACEAKSKAENEKGKPLTTWEAVKAMAPSYIPSAISGAITLSSIAGLTLLNNKQTAKLNMMIAGGNHIINQVSKKYNLLRNEVEKKDPDTLKDFDQKILDDQWQEYVLERMKKRAHCWGECLPLSDSSEYGERRMFCIEYGNGLADENGHELIFFEATPGDVIAAFYNLNGKFRETGIISMNDLFTFLGLPHTDLGKNLVWDENVLFDEWGIDFIDFDTQDMPMEENVPEPVICTMIILKIPPLSEEYAEGMNIPSCVFPTE